MPTEAQSKKIARLTSLPDQQKPIPTIPQLSEKLVSGTFEEKAAAIQQFNQDLIAFFKKSGVIQNS